ncbi:MAG: hypothetical protein RL307_466 [Pseudomonadota bacterium]|jgi:[NiFe] hydrogenase diaphorase moiety small subunit
MSDAFELDGKTVPFKPGQTLIQAAQDAGHHIPHLCWDAEFKPHGSCKLCTVKVNGRTATACTTPAAGGQVVENRCPELDAQRQHLLQLLFVEGNHFCPSCEKSGQCTLQANAYEMGMLSPHYDHFFPDRPVDASHPDVLLDFNRCIFCELCVRASRDVDGKSVFAIAGRGSTTHLIVNSPSGLLVDSDFEATDRAASVCPVGVILKKRVGFAVPIGARRFDDKPISQVQVKTPPQTEDE